MKYVNVPFSLIGSTDIDEKRCDDLITWFEEDDNFLVTEGNTAATKIDKKIKDSFDKSIPISFGKYPIKDYVDAVIDAAKQYQDMFTPLKAIKIRVSNIFNIQKYPKGGAYFAWHSERQKDSGKTNARVLAFMTYLNTIEEGGQTEFAMQQTAFKPIKGRTLIWPSEWSHLHRGIPAPKEEKYIATGWFELA